MICIKNILIKDKVSLIDENLAKYPILIFLSYRFVHGFRFLTPLVTGTSQTKTFLLLSGIGTVIWGAFYISIGYIFGEIKKSKPATLNISKNISLVYLHWQE